MTNLDTRPEVTPCHSAGAAAPVSEFFAPREVPLGGLRGMRVDRVLPQRGLPTVGAWCFLDQFGPQRIGMTVLPHPHIGLQTVTWPLSGEIRHRDTVGSDVVLRPGQLNLMTSGRGIAHSEVSVGDGELHALQLWVALPSGDTRIDPGFEQYTELPVFETGGARATVFMGAIGDAVSPATTYTPLLGADVVLRGGTEAKLPLRPDFEHAVLVVGDEPVTVGGRSVVKGPLLYLGTGRDELVLSAGRDAHLVLIGGEPFPDELVMWWNFVGRSHEEILAAREDWQAQDPARFGTIEGHDGEWIPAPELPGVRLTPRRRH